MRRLLTGLAAVTALAVGTGCGVVVQGSPQTPEPGQPVTTTSVTSPENSATPAAPAPATRPHHLDLAWIHAPVVRLSMDDDVLVPPSDPTVLGWWGRRAGAPRGATLLVGHTVHTGGGELDDLEDVPVGTVATVSGHEYRVTSNRVISKDALAERAEHLFGQSGEPRLVVVTCEGYDPATGHYDSNVVLVAEPV